MPLRRALAPLVAALAATGLSVAVVTAQVAQALPARADVLPGALGDPLPDLTQASPYSDGVLRLTASYGAHAKQNLDVYVPASAPLQQRPTVVFVHGGSWAIGDKSEWAPYAAEMARRGWTGVSLNYRLTPDAPWPAQRDDASAGLAYLQANAALLGIDADRIGALGDSAGGHLAALLGVARPGQAPVRSVVTLSGINDLPGLLQQRSSGGCAPGCTLSGLASKVAGDLMRCLPTTCAGAYREASPGALVTRTTPATMSFNSETELIDPRQAWVMDTALRRNGRPSRVVVMAGRLHARGYLDRAFEPAMRFLGATLTPEDVAAYPAPKVQTTLDLPRTVNAAVGKPVRMRGVVRPRAYGSSVALQVRGGDGLWRTVRTAPLQRGTYDTYYDTTWAPRLRGTTVWRALWTGGGGIGASAPVTITVR